MNNVTCIYLSKSCPGIKEFIVILKHEFLPEILEELERVVISIIVVFRGKILSVLQIKN